MLVVVLLQLLLQQQLVINSCYATCAYNNAPACQYQAIVAGGGTAVVTVLLVLCISVSLFQTTNIYGRSQKNYEYSWIAVL